MKHYNNAKNFAGNVYNTAQRLRAAIDKGARTAHTLYNVVSPALRQLGVNTGRADAIASRGVHGYNQIRDRVMHGHQVVSRATGQLSALGI